MPRHVISMLDLAADLEEIIDLAAELKKQKDVGEPLRKKTLALIFEKPSTRTRVSFEVAMAELGGSALYLSTRDLQLGRGETIADTARVLSRYVDAIMYRAYEHRKMEELAKYADVPVINGLDNEEHPCQAVADLLTIKEYKGGFGGRKLAYVGDGNNVCQSLMLGAAIVGLDFVAATPPGYEPMRKYVKKSGELAAKSGAELAITHDVEQAVKDADVIYTDVWVSMGDEAEKDKRLRDFQGYQVNCELVSKAKTDVIVMHCLPAHRGQEITDDVIDGEHSVVWDQAENRLHAQKAILLKLLG